MEGLSGVGITLGCQEFRIDCIINFYLLVCFAKAFVDFKVHSLFLEALLASFIEHSLEAASFGLGIRLLSGADLEASSEVVVLKGVLALPK